MKQVTINHKAYNFKYTLRALFIFEKITEKPFTLDSTMDTFTFFYCMLLANNEDFPLKFDDFIDACDNDQSIGNTMSEYLIEYFNSPLNQSSDSKQDSEAVEKKS